MQYLERISVDPSAAWYALKGDHQGAVERYVVSTPPSRAICNQPEVLGVEYTRKLGAAMEAALSAAPFRRLVASHPEEKVAVVHFLRGGLNFQLRSALADAYGFNRHCSAFMSSQRFKTDGRWNVKEDMYRKLELHRDTVLVMGDVVATGVTMGNGLQVILDHLHAIGSSARALVFFTIGCHKAEKVLEDFHTRAVELFPEYERTILVYVEGKFALVDSKTDLRICVQGTDLIRRDALLAPELERSMCESPAFPLERCAIYDAGSRAFDIPTYVEDVMTYWTEVAELARGGFTLREAIEERWPLPDDDAWRASRREAWRGIEPELVDGLLARRHNRLSVPGLDTADALSSLCAQRIETLATAGGLTRKNT